ncbi:MAG: hypothetical protein KGH88_03955 [Thaumarchaeota archaeon]|nr:hypothetical protein [Nitrososphaerota archaeon]
MIIPAINKTTTIELTIIGRVRENISKGGWKIHGFIESNNAMPEQSMI